MDYSVTCDGTPIGVAFIAPLAGLAHADLRPLSTYATIYDDAEDAARELREIRLWDVVAGDFAEEFARTWSGGRLALVDPTGTEIAAASVMVVNSTRARHGPRVIVDVRPDMSRVEAFLRTIAPNGGGRSRPST